jgi:hypothetical protein
LCIYVNGQATQSKPKARSQSVTTIPKDPLQTEAWNFAQAEWDAMGAKCGDSFYFGDGPLGDSGWTLHQYKDVSFHVSTPLPLSTANKMNGLEFLARAYIVASVGRTVSQEYELKPQPSSNVLWGNWIDVGFSKIDLQYLNDPSTERGADFRFFPGAPVTFVIKKKFGHWQAVDQFGNGDSIRYHTGMKGEKHISCENIPLAFGTR